MLRDLSRVLQVLRARGRFVPLVAQVLVTHRCNANCAYCFGHFPTSTLSDMEVPRFVALVDELRAAGCLQVALEGGDPLVRDDLGELLRVIRSRGLLSRVTTNGVALHRHLATLKQADTVVVSLDGDVEFNNRSKGIGTTSAILRDLAELRRAGDRLRINTTLTRGAVGQFDFLERLSRELDIPIKLNALMDFGAEGASDCELEDLDRTFARVRALKQRTRVVASWRVIAKYERWLRSGRRGLHRLDPQGSRRGKYCGKNVVMIDVDGWVYPCCVVRDRVANCMARPLVECMREIEAQNRCVDCVHFGFDDFNATMALDPRMAWNSLKNYRFY